MPFNQNNLPEWNKSESKPAQSKLNEGWKAEEKPPASIWNWYMNSTYKALQDLMVNAIHKEEKGAANGLATLDANGKLPATLLPENANVITAQLVTALPNAYPNGLSTFTIQGGTNANPWRDAAGHTGNMENVLVQTIKSTSPYIIIQRITFNNNTLGVTGIYERSSHANNSWSGAWKKVVDSADVQAVETRINNQKGAASGIATLDQNGRLTANQRPGVEAVTGDLNDVRTTGSYMVPVGATNAPTASNSFFMSVFTEGSLTTQICYGRINPNLMYMRRFNSTWSAWDNLSKGNANGVAPLVGGQVPVENLQTVDQKITDLDTNVAAHLAHETQHNFTESNGEISVDFTNKFFFVDSNNEVFYKPNGDGNAGSSLGEQGYINLWRVS